MPRIDFQNVTSKYFNENSKLTVVALDNFSVSFENNKITAILGENGCGKTTLIKCICDFQKYEGSILLDGKNINLLTTKKRNIGYVPQEIMLNPRQNVFDNIAFSLMISKFKAPEIRKRIYSLAEKLKISCVLNRKVNELSKGQQQRISIAKALVKDPDILLLDEPFSNLDKENKEIIFAMLKDFIQHDNKICIFVTHNTKDAVFYSDDIITMKEGTLLVKNSSNFFANKNLNMNEESANV